MHFDDRLATVLHHRAAGERAARVQFRQLLDLLGEPDSGADPSLTRAAFRRLEALALLIPLATRARIAGECSARIRNPRLIAWLAEAEPQIALAALSNAALTEPEWSALIPQLPIRARGLLRHRRNLPRAAVQHLERLGVHDRALPLPERQSTPAEARLPDAGASQNQPALELGDYAEGDYVLDPAAGALTDTAAHGFSGDTANLGALVRRIEEFQRARARRLAPVASDAPRLPLEGDSAEESARSGLGAVLFITDESGRIDWAEPAAALLLVGTLLTAENPAGTAFAEAFARRRPVSGAALEIAGAGAVAGRWIVEGAPRFTPHGGRFAGYIGRLRRPAPAPADTRAVRAADRVRQLLHELRTPVTAIQGFAEVIQQQTVGPVPHEYRALAAAIAGDAARMLAGFVEIERLSRLEAGTQELPEGSTDFAVVARRQVAQLQTVLSPRVSRIDAHWQTERAIVGLAPEAAEMLAWRFMGTIAAAIAAGERVRIELAAGAAELRLSATLPAALAQVEDVFAGSIRQTGGALGIGLFGAGFALRLARAEARAAGGDLQRENADCLVLTLPLAAAEAAPEAAPQRRAVRAKP